MRNQIKISKCTNLRRHMFQCWNSSQWIQTGPIQPPLRKDFCLLSPSLGSLSSGPWHGHPGNRTTQQCVPHTYISYAFICIHIILFKTKITQHWNFWRKFGRQNILKIKGEFSTQFKRPLLEAKSVDAMEGCKITKFGWGKPGKPLKSRKRLVACGDG